MAELKPVCPNGHPRNQSGEVMCPRCREPFGMDVRGAVVRVGRTAPVPLAAGRPLEIGRMSPAAGIALPLNAYDDVSRAHGVLELRGDAVEITDTSTFGMFVGDRRLPEGRPTSFPLPVTIRLGSSCVIEVDWQS
jgi:hypothetical protein